MHLNALLVLSIFVVAKSSAQKQSVLSFKEQKVFDFVAKLSNNKELSEKCAKSLTKIVPLLTSNFTLTQQRQFYSDSFGSGEAHQFLSRDLDR